MTLDLQKILVVEDNMVFLEAAAKFLDSRKLNYQLTNDYDFTMPFLHNQNADRFKGAIIDCFFPKATGSNDISLGELAIEKMLATDTGGQRIEEYEKYLLPYFDPSDSEVRNIVRYVGSISKEKPMQSALASVMKLIGSADKRAIGHLLKESKFVFNGIEHFRDHYESLRKAIEKDPSNQALGILIAEECKNRGLPFVLATSTYHHDNLTQPIANYCSRNRWTLVDCNQNNPNEKSTPEFWERAYDALLERLKKLGGKMTDNDIGRIRIPGLHGIFEKVFDSIGVHPTLVALPVLLRPGDSLGEMYVIPENGRYFGKEEIARKEMQEGQTLYGITVRRIE